MRPDPIELPHPPQAADEESRERDNDNACLEVELDGRAGLGRLFDARVFQPARREYARRLLEALCEHPGVRKAEVDLASSTCRVEFDLDSNTRAVMGRILVEAIRTASARTGKTPWWRRTPRWSTLTAYRSFGDLSLWETYADEPGSVRLVHRGHARPRHCLPSSRQPRWPRRGRAMPRVAMVAPDHDRLRSGRWLIGQSHGGPRGANPGGAEGCRSEGSRLEVGRCA